MDFCVFVMCFILQIITMYQLSMKFSIIFIINWFNRQLDHDLGSRQFNLRSGFKTLTLGFR